MKRIAQLVFLLELICFAASAASGQAQTTVTGTIKDPNGLAYSFGTVKAQVSPPGVQSPCVTTPAGDCVAIQGTVGPAPLDVNGHFTLNLYPNASITPAATQWTFTVCIAPGIPPPAGTGPQCFSSTATIAGASQDVSTNLQSSTPSLYVTTTGSNSGLFAIKPAASNAVQYISANGNDTNDGFSMGSAKGNADLGTAVAAAETAIGAGSGQIFILPGSYTSTTAIQCASDVSIFAFGASVTYSGASQAILCANITRAHILGGKFFGPSTSGSTIGLQLGIGSGGSGVVTQYNSVSDVYLEGFGIGVKIEGSPSNNGTFENELERVQADTNGVGWDIRPTVANEANANRFVSDLAIGNTGDGWKLDGANGNVFIGVRAELNGGFGWNFLGVSATQFNSFFGVWGESNTSGDFNSGSAVNVTETRIEGGTLSSTPNFAGSWTGGGNVLQIQARRDWYLNAGNPATFHIGSIFGNNLELLLENDDASPPSGITGVLAYNRTGANAGSLFIGTPEFPATFRSTALLGTNSLAGLGTPTMGACGTSPLITGSNNAFTVTTGSGTVTSCTVNFGTPVFTRIPVCVLSDSLTTITGDVSAISTTSVTFSFSATLTSGKIYAVCF